MNLEAGQVAEIRDVTACGANSVGTLGPDRLAVAVGCTYQLETLDFRSGAVCVFEGFRSIAHLRTIDDTAFLRCKSFGYVARLRPGDERITTLDLNVDGPTLGDLATIEEAQGDVWIVGLPTDSAVSPVLFRIDPGTLDVVAC